MGRSRGVTRLVVADLARRSTLDYVYMSDIETPAPDLPGAYSTAANSGGTGQTARQLAEKVVELVGGKSKVVIARPLPVDDPLQRCPDISLARDKLKWEPKVELADGLARTIAYFRRKV